MPARPGRHIRDDGRELLAARVAELEQRIVLLEARVRRATTEGAEKGKGTGGRATRPGARPRPRCPGCLLELPKGRRGEKCVWCGFYFAAVRSRAAR